MKHSVISVKLEADNQQQISKVFTIMKNRIEARCPASIEKTQDNPDIILSIKESLPSETFQITQTETENAISISSGSMLGLIYGVGKFLRTSQYSNTFTPSSWRGKSSPKCPLRGIYFASHFHNWYEVASEQEIREYLEDLALWGYNTIWAIHPIIHLTGWDDPQSDYNLERLGKLFKTAKSLGLATSTFVNNVGFTSTPEHVRAKPVPDPLKRHGNSGNCICPSIPDGKNLILDITEKLLDKLSDYSGSLDYLGVWPYDEGGCGCNKCMPWGANGYLRMASDLSQLARSKFPNIKIILSTWTFDTPDQGEWKGLTDFVSQNPDTFDYILADSHEDFPQYPLNVCIPGNLPLINFPEISMWGNRPWGGFGAHPLPSRLQKLWNQVKHIISGGFPYSEGIYEDISKIVISQFYWDSQCSATTTLREYIAYEFSPDFTEEILTMINILESSATNSFLNKPVDIEAVKKAADISEKIDSQLPEWAKKSWRWRILHLRAIIDRERFVAGSLETDIAQQALMQLFEIYHCPITTDDPYHHRVRPPVRGMELPNRL